MPANKSFLIVGGTSGVGKAIGEQLLASYAGCSVLVTGLESTCPPWASECILGDIRDEDTHKEILKTCDRVKPDTVFFSAAQTSWGFANNTKKNCKKLIDINVRAIVQLHSDMQSLLPNQTLYVFISSLLGCFPGAYLQSCYGASKSFINSYVHGIHSEGQENVRLCILGGVDTPMSAKFMTRQDIDKNCMSAKDVASHIVANYRTSFVTVPGFMNKVAYKCLKFLPAFASKWMLRNIYGNLYLKQARLRVAVIGNGNVGTYFAHTLSLNNSSRFPVRWFARSPVAGPVFLNNTRVTVTQEPMEDLDYSSVDLCVFAVPSHTWAAVLTPLPPKNVALALVCAGFGDLDHHASLLAGRDIVVVGFGMMVQSVSVNKRVAKAIPFNSILLSGSKRLTTLLNYLLPSSRVVADVDAKMAASSVFLTLLVHRMLQLPVPRMRLLTWADFEWAEHNTWRITGQHFSAALYMFLFTRVDSDITLFMEQHYSRLSDQNAYHMRLLPPTRPVHKLRFLRWIAIAVVFTLISVGTGALLMWKGFGIFTGMLALFLILVTGAFLCAPFNLWPFFVFLVVWLTLSALCVTR